MQVPRQVAAELEVEVLEDGWIASVPSEACSGASDDLWAWLATPLPDWIPRRNLDTVGELLLMLVLIPIMMVVGIPLFELGYDGDPPLAVALLFLLPFLAIFLSAKYLLAAGPTPTGRWIFRVRSGVLQIDWAPVEVFVADTDTLLLSDERALAIGHLSEPSRRWLAEILGAGGRRDVFEEDLDALRRSAPIADPGVDRAASDEITAG